MEILHIANTNASDEIVLNDEYLLQLVTRYPFLYDATSPVYKDPDYDEWAWEEITNAFNHTYQSNNIKFTVAILQERWQSLQPLIIGLSRSNELSCISLALSDIIRNLSMHLRKAKKEHPKEPLTIGHELILKNIELVKELPLNMRISMETEIIGLLLAAELVTHGDTNESVPHNKRGMKQEFYEFMQTLQGIKPTKKNKVNNGSNPTTIDITEQSSNSNTNSSDIIDLESESSQSSCVITEGFAELIVPDPIPAALTVDDDIKYNMPRVVNEPILNDDALDNEKLNDGDIKYDLPDCSLKIATVSSVSARFVPLTEARKYTRRCAVRVKRLIMEDYMPLSKIKRESRTK